MKSSFLRKKTLVKVLSCQGETGYVKNTAPEKPEERMCVRLGCRRKEMEGRRVLRVGNRDLFEIVVAEGDTLAKF